MGNYYQGNAAPTYRNSDNAANWPMSSTDLPGTTNTPSTLVVHPKKLLTRPPQVNTLLGFCSSAVSALFVW